MDKVYILNKKGEPLMPTKRFGRVRKLLKNKMAVPVMNNPFTIRLKYDTSHYTQPVFEGLDPGRENIGNAVSLEDGTNIYLADIETCNKSIKINMKERADYRKERRSHDRQSKQRKAVHDNTEIINGDEDVVRTKHQCKSRKVVYPGAEKPVTHKVIQGKEAKFNNRKRPKGWITPSARQIIQITMNEIRQTAKILPVTNISIERVAFDFQKLENENIRNWEYSKGPLYGYKTYKDYIWDEQHGECACCGKPITQYHHIIPRSKGGIDNVKNIIGLCDDCHNGVHENAKKEERLKNLKEGLAQKYQVGLLNSVMPVLIEEVSKYCKEHNIKFTITDGKKTSETRKKYNFQKDHCVDAYAISLADRDINKTNVKLADTIYVKRRFKKKSKNIISANNKRVYLLDGKEVAYNRHKATDQKEDSLEEFMASYAKGHTEKECRQLIHKLTIQPARRIYTYRKEGIAPPARPGDMILYSKTNKIKGNTKSLVFPAYSVEFSESVCSENGEKRKKREWKIRIDNKKIRRAKFCHYLSGGCLQITDYYDTKAYLNKIAQKSKS